MKEKTRSYLITIISTLLGTSLMDFMIVMIWFTDRGRTTPGAVCGGVNGSFEQCLEVFLQGQIIFTFLLPFFIFLPVGYVIAMNAKKGSAWVCKYKWMISTFASLAMFVTGLLLVYSPQDFLAGLYFGILFSIATAILLTTAWTVFFHRRCPIFK